MKYRQLGRSGLRLSPIGLGTLTLGTQLNESESVSLIKGAIDRGINFLDTADTYGEGKSEEMVGKAIRGQRDSVFVVSKAGNVRGARDYGTLSRKFIMQSIEASLRRLDTDYIDIYYAHTPDYETSLEETMRALDDLIRQGKVRYIGCSNFKAWMVCKALWLSDRHNLHRFECVQPPYNLLARDIEYELMPLCASEGLGVCVFNPLAGELLTGRHEFGKPPAEGRMTDEGIGRRYLERYWSEANFIAVDRLKKAALDHGRSMAQFALAWIFNNPHITSLLSGSTSLAQLDENLKAVELVLSPEELSVCDAVWQMFRPARQMYGR